MKKRSSDDEETKRGNTAVFGFRARLALGTALASMALVGYGGRAAYAGLCTGAAGTYSCSGAANSATDVTQYLTPVGPLTVTTTSGFGIDTSISGGYAFDMTGTGGLSFTDANTSAITGGYGGIYSLNYSSGALSISTTGQVTGNTGTGIFAENYGAGLTVSAAGVTGGEDGIVAANLGTGNLTVTATGTVEGQGLSSYGYGIYALNYIAGADLTIDTAAVTGAEIGILAHNDGTGALSVTASGAVEGTSGIGIYAVNVYGTDLLVESAAVTGGYYGIFADSYGIGDLSITATGPVEGTNGVGILALASGFNLTIEATSASGAYSGIDAHNYGSGALSITTTGAVTGTAYDGIYAANDGAFPLSVTVSGAVTGGSAGHGIHTVTGGGGSSVITLNSGATVSATSGDAIFNDEGDSTTTVNSGASVIGTIELSEGSDALTFDGGSFAGVTLFDGGDDTDSLTFMNAAGTLAGADIVNFEEVVIGSGAEIGFSDSLLDTETLRVETGGTFVSEIRSAIDFDFLEVTGDVDFGIGSLIDFVMTDVTALEYDLFDGLSLTFLTADSVLGFGNLAFNFIDLNPHFKATVSLDGGTSLSVSFSDVPAPSPLILLGTGLLGLAGLRRARRRRETRAVL